jgi:hypothetical protein
MTVAAAGLLSTGGAVAQSSGDINIAPKRVVFAPNQISGTVYIFNRGGAATTYDISLVDRVMVPTGEITAVADLKPDATNGTANPAAALMSAKTFLVHTPRRVTLQPGETQTVRLRVLRPPTLAPGEYRTHLTVTAVPAEDAGLTAEQAAGLAPRQVETRVTTLFAISIPIIVRQGPPDVRAALENVSYTPPRPGDDSGSLGVDLVRLGTASLYGDIEVRAEGRPGLIGVMRGIAVYPELGRRPLAVRLTQAPPPHARLTISFRDQDTKLNEVLTTISYSAP